jgi:thiamine-phosphate pyrophosphorylase
MFRYSITSRALFPGDELQRQNALLRQASRWIADGIDLIQLREKDLPDADIAAIARKMIESTAGTNSPTKILINSRADIAIVAGAHGVHLTADPNELSPGEVRGLYASANLPTPIITISCHALEDVGRARDSEASAILFAPVFEKVTGDKVVVSGQGLDKLRAACREAFPVPVYALGGVTLENAPSCLAAGASGIAGIRLFHNG